MALPFASLIASLTFAQVQQLLLSALQGLGIVVPSNGTASGVAVGTGSVSLAGSPIIPLPLSSPAACIAQISLGGEPGVAQVQISLDGGLTYAAAVTIPSNGQVAITGTQGATGATATFLAGPVGSGTSFVAGDQYAFSLTSPSFPVNSWQSLSVPRTLVGMEAQALASFSQLQAAIAAGGFAGINPATGTPYATGPWMDLVAQNVYNLTRRAAVATIGQMTLTDSASQGPFTIAAGQLLVLGPSGQLYQNTTGGTLTKGGTLNLQWQCTLPGSAGNIANGSTLSLSTILPGVTVTNPAVFNGNTTWISTQGADPETDLALSARCTGQWSTLGIGATAATYNAWAIASDPSIQRTRVVLDAVIPGQVDVYCAGTGGGSGGSAVTNAQNYINARIPLGLSALVAAATNVLITLTGTVFFFNAKTNSAAATAAVSAALTAFFNAAPIGLDNIPTVFIYLNDLIGVIESAMGTVGTPNAGIQRCTLTNPTTDTGLLLGQVATLTNSLTFTGV